jgi:hypothetical protein
MPERAPRPQAGFPCSSLTNPAGRNTAPCEMQCLPRSRSDSVRALRARPREAIRSQRGSLPPGGRRPILRNRETPDGDFATLRNQDGTPERSSRGAHEPVPRRPAPSSRRRGTGGGRRIDLLVESRRVLVRRFATSSTGIGSREPEAYDALASSWPSQPLSMTAPPGPRDRGVPTSSSRLGHVASRELLA